MKKKEWEEKKEKCVGGGVEKQEDGSEETFVWPWVRIFYKSTYVSQTVAHYVRLRLFPEKAGIAARRATSVGSGAPVQVLGLY